MSKKVLSIVLAAALMFTSVNMTAYAQTGSGKEDGTAAVEATEEPTVTPEATEEPTVTPEATEEPTVTPEAAEEPTVTPEATEEPTVTPEATEEPTVTPEATEEPTVTPEAIEEPTMTPEAAEVPTITPEVPEIPLAEVTEPENEDELLGAKVIEGDYTISNTVFLEKDWIINGNLTVTGAVYLRSYQLTVNGNVILGEGSKGAVFCNTGKLSVQGDLLLQNILQVETGSVDVGGDFRIQKHDEDGDYVKGTASITMNNASANLNIGGDFICQNSPNSMTFTAGTITLKGNLEQLERGYWLDLSGIKLIMNGSSAQQIRLPDSGVNISNKIGYLQLDNSDITVSGYLDTSLVSNGTIKVGSEGLHFAALNLNGYTLTIQGDVKASGIVTTGSNGGHLIVTGNYTQISSYLNVGKGIVDIGGDLRLQGEDAAGNAAVGTGYITMTETEGKLNIGKNFILQSSASGKYEYGIITLKGDLTQLDTYNNFVGKYGHRVILAGDGAQQVSFKNNNNTFNILELKKAMSNYKFSPARCWVTLVGVNPEWPFVDIPINENNWKYKSAKYVYENNIMSGMNSADGTVVFQPDTPMNRAMFAAVIYRMAGNPDVSYEPVFTDVAPGKWYSDAIVWAYKRGIVSGYSDGRFGVNDNITREQMARMLKEYADVQKYGTSERGNVDTFVDSKNISKWATEYVKWAVGSGLISGKIENGQKYIDPRGNATRAECASMLMRFIEKYQK